MKISFGNGILTITAETNEERDFLDKAGQEGLRHVGTGSSNVLALPSEAKLTQFNLNSDEVTMLIVAVSRSDMELRRSYGGEKVNVLLDTLLHTIRKSW